MVRHSMQHPNSYGTYTALQNVQYDARTALSNVVRGQARDLKPGRALWCMQFQQVQSWVSYTVLSLFAGLTAYRPLLNTTPPATP